jgi:hypothetical protein
MIEGSGSGSIPLTSESGWPKNIRIQRIRIRNTDKNYSLKVSSQMKIPGKNSQLKIYILLIHIIYGAKKSTWVYTVPVLTIYI